MENANRITFRFLLVTDRTNYPANFLERIELAARSGIDAIQIREKDLPGGRYLSLARSIKDITDRHHMPVIINDRVDIAVAAGCDGIHLPGNSFSPATVRKVIGSSMLIGKSTHHLREIMAAAEEGSDYVVFGPVYETPSKREYGPPQGIAKLNEICRLSPVPVFAIGGITVAGLKPVMDAGAFGIGVITAVLGSPDIPSTISEFREALNPYL